MVNEYFDIANIYMPYFEDLKAPIITPKEYGMYKANKRHNKRKNNKRKNKK